LGDGRSDGSAAAAADSAASSSTAAGETRAGDIFFPSSFGGVLGVSVDRCGVPTNAGISIDRVRLSGTTRRGGWREEVDMTVAGAASNGAVAIDAVATLPLSTAAAAFDCDTMDGTLE
jgi:hypothetical protein